MCIYIRHTYHEKVPFSGGFGKLLKGVSMECGVGGGKVGEIKDGDRGGEAVVDDFITAVSKGMVGGRDGSKAVGFGQVFDAGEF